MQSGRFKLSTWSCDGMIDDRIFRHPTKLLCLKMQFAAIRPKPLHCCCALASVRELSLAGFVHGQSLSPRMDVGGVPLISGDPVPHGLCSWPSSQWGSDPRGCCIPCHKKHLSTQPGYTHCFSLVQLQLVPRRISDLPLWIQQTPLSVMLFARARQRDVEHLVLLPKDCWTRYLCECIHFTKTMP